MTHEQILAVVAEVNLAPLDKQQEVVAEAIRFVRGVVRGMRLEKALGPSDTCKVTNED